MRHYSLSILTQSCVYREVLCKANAASVLLYGGKSYAQISLPCHNGIYLGFFLKSPGRKNLMIQGEHHVGDRGILIRLKDKDNLMKT
jgi:hypothetical protein